VANYGKSDQDVRGVSDILRDVVVSQGGKVSEAGEVATTTSTGSGRAEWVGLWRRRRAGLLPRTHGLL
jgi:hypothetical protein